MGKFLLAALQQGAGWGIGKPFWPWFWPWLSSASDAPDNGRVITAMQVLMLNSLDRRTVPLLSLAGRQRVRPHHTHTHPNKRPNKHRVQAETGVSHCGWNILQIILLIGRD